MILAVTELHERRHEARWQRLARDDVRVFFVETDDAQTPLREIREHPHVPKRGQFHPGDWGSFCQGVTIEALADDPRSFRVECAYSSDTPTDDEQEENPLLRPAVIQIDGEPAVFARLRDLDGKAFINSAGDPIEPGPEVPGNYGVIEIARNEPALNPLLVWQYQDSVNSDEFMGLPPLVVLLQRIRAAWAYENGFRFAAFQYRFLVNWETWRHFELDRGYRKLVDGKLMPIFDELGNQVGTPRLLDGEGGLLEDVEKPEFLEFRLRRELPFAALGF